VRPIRITKKRIVVSVCALEDFLGEFTAEMVDAIETVWEYAYETKEAEERAKGKPDDAPFDEDDDVGNALFELEFAMEYLRDMFSSRSIVPDGGYHASQVIVGKRAGTITIVRNSSPETLGDKALREYAGQLADAAEQGIPPPPEPTSHTPIVPMAEDLEPVLVELLEERHAVN
jgi:hypothetical protein